MAKQGAGSTGMATTTEDRAFAERARAAAHRPAVAVSGPYGRPFHPMLVTVPIGAFVSTVAFDVASKTVEGQAYARPAQWLALIGIVSGVVAALAGFVDYRRLTKGTRAHKVATTHMLLMDVALLLFIASFFLRLNQDDAFVDGTAVLPMALGIVGLLVLVVGGWFGGKLPYSYGVRVVDEEDQLAGYFPESKVDERPAARSGKVTEDAAPVPAAPTSERSKTEQSGRAPRSSS